MNISKNKIDKLLKNTDFKYIKYNGKSISKDGVIIKAIDRRSNLNFKNNKVRIGFTCSKKIGNAVKRNKAKRRLNALSRIVFPYYSQCGWDYVLIGKKNETLNIPFEEIKKNMIDAIKTIHKVD